MKKKQSNGKKNPAQNSSTTRIAVVAPSSVLHPSEMEQGIAVLRELGWDVMVSKQCFQKHLFFAGKDEARAKAVWDAAWDPQFTHLWSARGGYGANHLIPLLLEWTRQKGVPPKKTYVGYSDATVLLHFVKHIWGWDTVHAVMPAHPSMVQLRKPEVQALVEAIEGRNGFEEKLLRRLKPLFKLPMNRGPISGVWTGGNLAVWTAMLGTEVCPVKTLATAHGDGYIWFVEDIGETPSRIDRMVQQLEQAGFFKPIKAIVLGDFLDCEDRVPMVTLGKRKLPLRNKVSLKKSLVEIFAPISNRYRIPVWTGYPAGHGPGHFPVLLGKRATIDC